MDRIFLKVRESVSFVVIKMQKNVITNKKASFNYFLEDKYEAGIVLTGTEIKSIRNNNVNIQDSYILIKNNELFILNMHIAEYKFGNIFNHDPFRTRKLLMHKKQILKLQQKLKQDGYTLVPTRLYFNDNNILKVEIALAKGKKNYDKRESIKQKDIKREIQRKYK